MTRAIKVLLVDNNSEHQLAMKRLLEQNKTVVAVAGGADRAGAQAAAETLEPDVILVSVERPLVQSLRVVERLAAVGGAPVVVVSSIADADNLHGAMRSGAREYLVEPISAGNLLKALEKVFTAWRRREAFACGDVSGPGITGELITLLGPTGGVGKTTLATNLAVAVSRETKGSVCLVDLDLELGDVCSVLDLLPQKNIVDALLIADKLEAPALPRFLCKHASGVQVLAAGDTSRPVEAINDHNVEKTFRLLTKAFEYVVVDTSARLGGTFPSVLEQSPTLLVVTAPHPTSVKHTAAMLEKLLHERGYDSEKVKLVVSEAYDDGQMSSANITKALSYPVFYRIPHDHTVTRCFVAGKTCVETYPRAKISKCITELARALTGA